MKAYPEVLEQRKFEPPYCSNPKCRFHSPETVSREKPKYRFFLSKGWAKTKHYPFVVKVFRCKTCKKSFRFSYFQLEYREQKRGLNPLIFKSFFTGASNRELGRQLSCSESLIRRRLKKMAQWGILKHSQLMERYKLHEPVVYDGLQAFAKSQFDPNHIQQVLGKDSGFILDFNFVPLNRSGRMSPRQKKIRSHQECLEGRYSPKAIRTATAEILKRVSLKRADPLAPLILYSDRHFQYERAVRNDLKHLPIAHVRISSKDTRNFQNHLFAVNHSDLLIRQHVGAFSRETISFSKTPAAMILKFVLFLIYKNYFRTQFVKKHKRKPKAHVQSPAMAVGLTDHLLSFYEFFDQRITPTQIQLNREWLAYYHGHPVYLRQLTQT
jgi:hypothetical protein